MKSLNVFIFSVINIVVVSVIFGIALHLLKMAGTAYIAAGIALMIVDLAIAVFVSNKLDKIYARSKKSMKTT